MTSVHAYFVYWCEAGAISHSFELTTVSPRFGVKWTSVSLYFSLDNLQDAVRHRQTDREPWIKEDGRPLDREAILALR